MVNFLWSKLNLICFGIILIATFIIELGLKKNWFTNFNGRKILHIIVITTMAYCIYKSPNRIYLSYVFLVLSILLFFVVYFKLVASNLNNSYGVALFPLAFFVLLQMPFLHIHTVMFAIITLVFADAGAAYYGTKYGIKKIVFLHEKKSWIGFISFLIITVLLYAKYFGLTFMNLAILVALVPALTELFSYKGSDNFTIPIITALWTHLIFSTNNAILLHNSIYSLLLLALAIIAFYKKWLTISGGAAAFFLGILVVFFGAPIYLIPLAIFFILGSLASHLNKDELEKNGRSAVQVFANGLVAVVCLVLFYFIQNNSLLIAFFASIAISLSDTISSEIGRYKKQRTYNIIGFQKIIVGLSGGISVAGTLGGLLAAALFSITAYFIFKLSITELLMIAIVGFLGMLLDSVLGSLLQAKYKTENNQINEVEQGQLINGFEWCTNDVVNVLSNIITTLVFLLFYNIL
jgi:uncharacterized protein (TIGR00297 family)